MKALLASSMEWMDGLWDDDAALLWSLRRRRHLVRETAWYALGCMQGNRADRAARALRSVLSQQFDAPGAPYDGTYRRSPEEGDLPADAVMWVHYDPNWRQFIGATFALICDRFEGDLDRGLVDELRASTAKAVSSEAAGRVSPTYANIALMKAWLDDDDAFAANIADAFDGHGAFLEYNSPTYYGIDLFALALWRDSSKLAPIGRRLEAALWRDIARFYHAGLRNMCGPFDRAYGMDMTSYATPLGLWIWSLVGADRAPFPDPQRHFAHPYDFCFAPCVAAFEPCVPDDVRESFEVFGGEHTVEQVVSTDPRRVATAWLSDDVMIGAHSGPPSGIGLLQHHHATMHWRRSGGGVGSMRLRPGPRIDASASASCLRMSIKTVDPIVFDVHPPPAPDETGWSSDGIRVRVETNASGPVVSGDGEMTYVPREDETTFLINVL